MVDVLISRSARHVPAGHRRFFSGRAETLLSHNETSRKFVARIAMHVFAQTPVPRPDRSYHCFQDSAALLSTIALATEQCSASACAGHSFATAALAASIICHDRPVIAKLCAGHNRPDQAPSACRAG